MAEVGTPYTSGDWIVTEGKEDEFIAAWSAFLDWAIETFPNVHFATLVQQKDDPRHFISFGEWGSWEEVAAWRSHPEFPEKIGAARSLCEHFVGKDYSVVASASAG